MGVCLMEDRIARHHQPCWECTKAYGGCAWSARFEPVPGWIATRRQRSPNGAGGVGDTYAILYCPEFTQEARHT